MLLSTENIVTLKEPIMTYLDNNYLKEMSELNRNGKLDQLFFDLHLYNILDLPKKLETKNKGKILVIGESLVKIKDLLGIAKSLNIDKNCFEFVTDYENIKNYEFNNLKHNNNYRLILVGPIPHKVVGLNGKLYCSIIDQMEQNPKVFPKVKRLQISSKLKITKTNFKNALSNEVQKKYI